MLKLAMLSGCSYRWGQGKGRNARRNCGWRAPTTLIALIKMAHQLGRGTHACRAARSGARLKWRSTVAPGTLPQKCWWSQTSLRSGESGRFRPVCLDILSSFPRESGCRNLGEGTLKYASGDLFASEDSRLTRAARKMD